MTKTTTLTTRTARSRLALGRWHFQPLRVGLAVGWRRRGAGAGTWCGRMALANGRATVHVVGTADDLGAGMDAADAMTYADAVRAVTAWAAQRAGLDTAPSRMTVRGAVEAYQTACRGRGQDRYADDLGGLMRLHLGSLADLRVDRLTVTLLRRWRAGLAADLSPGRRNNLADMLGAALRHADIVPRETLRRGLAAHGVREAVPPRRVMLTDEQVAEFVKAAYVAGEDIGRLVEVVAVTGCRPAQVIRCKVEDLDVRVRTLRVPPSKKGRAAIKHPTVLPLPPALAKRLAKPPHGPNGLLLGRSYEDGVRSEWIRSAWADLVRDVIVPAAGLPPGTGLYHLRHSAVMRALLRGVPLSVVARALDTSERVIARAYSSALGGRDEAVEMLRRALA